MKYDYAIFIGRFQPFHIGHKRVLDFAYQHANKTIVLVGSSNMHRSPKNPFTFEERKYFIQATVQESTLLAQPIIEPINDVPYNDNVWITQVRERIDRIIRKDWQKATRPPRIVLIGFKKDMSSYYLDMFREWDFIASPQHGTINATDIRTSYYHDPNKLPGFIADDVKKQLRKFADTNSYKWLVNEQQFLNEYRKQWGPGPFVTADCVVVQSGNILLVTRDKPPYEGALALPGGFVNLKERIVDGAVRELREETKISDDTGLLPYGVLKSFIRWTKTYDDPDRDARARIITQAHLLQLPDAKNFHIKGSDDARDAKWYSLASLDPKQFMADHWFIIQEMTGTTWK